MLDRIIAQITLALVSYIEQRIERGKTARDADPDPDRLRRGGARIREWLRQQQNGVRARGKSDEGRP